jgi:hypothetical protein
VSKYLQFQPHNSAAAQILQSVSLHYSASVTRHRQSCCITPVAYSHTVLLTSFSSVKRLGSLFPHIVPAWQSSREEPVCAWPKMRCFQCEINSGGAPHALQRSYRRGDLRQVELHEAWCLTPSLFTMSQVACRIETFLQAFWYCIQSLLFDAMRSVYDRYMAGTVPLTACPFSFASVATELFDDNYALYYFMFLKGNVIRQSVLRLQATQLLYE